MINKCSKCESHIYNFYLQIGDYVFCDKCSVYITEKNKQELINILSLSLSEKEIFELQKIIYKDSKNKLMDINNNVKESLK